MPDEPEPAEETAKPKRDQLPWETIKKAGSITPDYQSGFPGHRGAKIKVFVTVVALLAVAFSGLAIMYFLSRGGGEDGRGTVLPGLGMRLKSEFKEEDLLDDPKYQAAWEAMREGKISRGLDLVESLERKYPGSGNLAVTKASGYFLLNDFERALETVVPGLQKNPDHPIGLGVYGIVLHRKGEIEESTRALEKALSLDGKLIDGWYFLGVNYHKLNRMEEAEACFRRALQLNPQYTQLYWDLSLLYDVMGRAKESEEAILQAVEKAPRDPLAYRYLSMFHCRHGRFEEAKVQAENAIKLAPGNADNYSWLVEVQECLGDIRGAVQTAESAYSLSPEDPRFQLQLGHLYSSTGRLPESNLLLQRVIDQEPENYYALLLRGQNQTNLRRFAQARKSLEAAVNVSPDSPMAWEVLISVYEGLNLPEEAAKAREQVEILEESEPEPQG